MILLGALQWRPHLGPLLCGLLILALAGWMTLLYQRLRTRLSKPRTLLLLAPKALVLLALLLALFEPVWSVERKENTAGRIVTLLDTSTSMEVKDDPKETRLGRAQDLLRNIKKNLPAGVSLEELEFDSDLRAAPAARKPGLRETDLGGALAALSDRKEISSALAVLLLTDGGDETVENPLLPSVPLHVIGLGTDPATWNDLAIADLEHPPVAEKDVEFEVNVDLKASAGGGMGFAQKLGRVNVTLEEERSGQWTRVANLTADLSNHRARVKFPVQARDLGLRHYRAVAEGLPGELSLLNNTRSFSVDVQKKSLHVLFFTRELGADFKMIRAELGRDPGVAFTAFFRTVSEKFTLQGDRMPGDEEFEAGFPTSDKLLAKYDCLILGACPAEEWTDAQMKTLVRYVENGGVAIFLGGERSYGHGGYAPTPLAALFPWRISASEPEMTLGVFPVKVPLAASGHPIVSGLEELLVKEGAVVESLNPVDELKPGATALLETRQNARAAPIIAVQPVAKGKVMAVASNTLWKWGARSEFLRNAFGLLWRQSVRNLTGKSEGGRVFTVKWDKDAYRPGEQAVADIRVVGPAPEGLRFSASLGETNLALPVPVEPVQGLPGAYSAKFRLRARGEYAFKLGAWRGENALESYDKTFRVATLADEGSRLELDQDFLKKLAARGSGAYFRESDAAQFVKRIASGLGQRTMLVESSLVQAGPWFALAFLVLLVVEWLLRRRMNLF